MSLAPSPETSDATDGGDADGDAPQFDTLFATETMAELSARQGRIGDAIAIYRHLLSRPSRGVEDDEWHARWTERLAALVARGPDERPRAKAAAPAPPSGEAGEKRVQVVAPARPSHRLPVVVSHPVRSGQIVYAENNDLIVLGPVNPGAQLLADGNIHVYAPLRGRAVAGARGAADAQIFCLDLQAELVGVDTGYIPSDEIPPTAWGKPARVWLKDGRCQITPLQSAPDGAASKDLPTARRFPWPGRDTRR